MDIKEITDLVNKLLGDDKTKSFLDENKDDIGKIYLEIYSNPYKGSRTFKISNMFSDCPSIGEITKKPTDSLDKIVNEMVWDKEKWRYKNELWEDMDSISLVFRKQNKQTIICRHIDTIKKCSPQNCPLKLSEIPTNCSSENILSKWMHYPDDLDCFDTDLVKRLLERKELIYRDYLKTLHWKKVRELALEKSEGKCQLCNGCVCLNVHHRTYEHLGDEQNHLNDLTVLCKECHEKFHEIKEKPNRI